MPSTASAADNPVVAVFPLAGSAPPEMRDKVGYALRAKLNRDGTYSAIDGPTMADAAAQANRPVSLASTVDDLKPLASDLKPAVLIWGEVDGENGQTIRLKIADLRDATPTAREVDKTVSDPTQLRFAIESALETLPGIAPFEHPSETSVTDDPDARALWAKNPNLLADGDFERAGRWTALFRSERYPAPVSDALPAVDKICIYRLSQEPGEKPRNVLAMNLSDGAAQSNGLACLSEPFPIEPNTRYRISFRYRSDGPSLHVFVKGYTSGQDIAGQRVDREDYRRQVPPSGPTKGQWVTVVDDLNPQNPNLPVERLRVDLYAYNAGGIVMFSDVVVKAVGKQTMKAIDDALRPTTRP